MTTETNAEFLERMQQKAYTKLIFLAVQVDMPDLKRLIQQAERAQELEQEKEFFRRSFVELKAGDVITRKENARLREEVEFYKNKLNFTRPDESGMGSRLSRREKGLPYD